MKPSERDEDVAKTPADRGSEDTDLQGHPRVHVLPVAATSRRHVSMGRALCKKLACSWEGVTGGRERGEEVEGNEGREATGAECEGSHGLGKDLGFHSE